jgi:hypothetical protein
VRDDLHVLEAGFAESCGGPFRELAVASRSGRMRLPRQLAVGVENA